MEAVGAGIAIHRGVDGKRSRRSADGPTSGWRCRWRSRLARWSSFSPPPWGRSGIRAPQVVEREQRRARANDRLKEASDQLEARGKDALAAVRQFPDFMEPGDWSALDRRLSEEAGRIRGRHPGVEGGYYVPSRPEQPFLPALPNEPRQSEADEGSRLDVSAASPARRNLYDYVDTQVDAAYRKRNELSVVEDIPPYTIAIRTAPVRVNGRVVAATWTMTRLVDPIYIDQSARGYRLVRGPGPGRDRPLARS